MACPDDSTRISNVLYRYPALLYTYPFSSLLTRV